MGKIVGTTGTDGLSGRSGADTIFGLGGNDVIAGNEVGGRELLIGGSFESAKANGNTWGTAKSVGGWRTDTSIEVWGKDFLGVKATHGDKIVELDSDRQFSRFWQDVQTEPGKAYDFSFDFAARSGTALATNTIEVFWNGEKAGSFDPSSGVWAKGELVLIGTGGNDRLEFREAAGDNDSVGGLIDNVSLKTSGNGADVLFGGTGNDALAGLGGDDVIYGGSKPTSGVPTKATTLADNDVIRAGDGNDTVYGNNGDDQLYGERGNDVLFGGRGEDRVDGGIGSDRLFGNSGNDTLSDGDGSDEVFGGRGDDLIYAGAGEDRYYGGTGIDTLSFFDAKTGVKVDLSKHIATGMGTDSIHGIERVEGSAFDDVLKGSKFDDALVGGGGNDLLRGRGGADVLTGGEGEDTFLWKISDLTHHYETGAVDRITDFSTNDRLDLRELKRGLSIDDISSLLEIKDDGTNTHVYLDFGAGSTEFAVLENFSGHSIKDMLAEGRLLT